MFNNVAFGGGKQDFFQSSRYRGGSDLSPETSTKIIDKLSQKIKANNGPIPKVGENYVIEKNNGDRTLLLRNPKPEESIGIVEEYADTDNLKNAVKDTGYEVKGEIPEKTTVDRMVLLHKKPEGEDPEFAEKYDKLAKLLRARGLNQ